MDPGGPSDYQGDYGYPVEQGVDYQQSGDYGDPVDPQQVAGTSWDHEASTSAAGGDPTGQQWQPSTSQQGEMQPEQRPLNEAFSRFRNSMRAEARRSSQQQSLLGRLSSAPPPLEGQGAVVLPSTSVFPLPSQAAGINADIVSAFERYARDEFVDHAYGFGRFIWKRITISELIHYSRVSLRAPLLRRLRTTPVGQKAPAVFAHIKAYMEDPKAPGIPGAPPMQPTFMDKMLEMRDSAAKKLEPMTSKVSPALAPVKAKLFRGCLMLERKLHIRLCIPRSRLFHLHQVLLMGMRYEELRDEIYCQLIKQTSFNPHSLSNERGWQVMAICLATFPPSQKFRPSLEEHLNQVISGELGELPGIHDPEKIKAISVYCLGRLAKIVEVGARHVPPTLDEIVAAEQMERTPVNVDIPGASPQIISLDSVVTGQEITTEIASRLGLDNANLYGIFIVVNGVERYAGSHGFVLESYAEWNIAPIPDLVDELELFRDTRRFLMGQWASCLYNMDPDSVIGKDLAHGIAATQKQQEQEEIDNEEAIRREDEEFKGDPPEVRQLFADIHLLFKKNLFPVETGDTEEFTRARAFEYVQATHDVVNGLYVLEEGDAVTLAALQLRAEHGSSTDLADFLTIDIIERYGPKEYVTGFEKAWRNAILKKVATLPWEVDVDVCRKDYLEFLHSRCPLYGSSWFTVEPKKCPQMPKQVYLLLNISGVYFVDVRLKEQLLYLRYIEICSWGYSESSFSLVTGNLTYNMEFKLGTRNGREIAHAMQYFVNHTQL